MSAPARNAVLSLAAALAAALAATLAAARVEARTGLWFEAGPALGGIALDADLADYRWDTGASTLWGGRVLAGRGPFALGLSGWRSGTTQDTGLPGDPAPLAVSVSALSLTGLVRVARPLGCELRLGGQAGRLHAGWEPGSLVVDTGQGAPVEVVFADIDEWCVGLVAEIQRDLGRGLVTTVQADWSSFALDTAHRRGDEIVQERERFSAWAARVQVGWRWSR
ncbi:MAG: hypothetical protein IPK64_17350 [bacterium]|nr:hypothetical protein [bacterium]